MFENSIDPTDLFVSKKTTPDWHCSDNLDIALKTELTCDSDIDNDQDPSLLIWITRLTVLE